jgi:hypothetical protein
MKKIWWLFGFTLLLAGSTVYLYLKTILVQFTVQNNIPGYRFGISSLAGNLFLYSQGYKTNYKKVNIVFTAEKQEGARLLLEKSETPTSSMNLQKENDAVTIWEQYSDNALVSIMNDDEIERYKISVDEDLYAYLCLAFDALKPSKAECYQKAKDFIKKFAGLPITKIVKTTKETSFHLVKKAIAACAGTIPCGGSNTGWHCSASNIGCPSGPSGGECSSSDGTCIWGDYCDPTLNTLDCSVVSNQSTCQTAGISQCAVSCNTSGDTFCTWGGTATPPPGGGGCTCNCMSAIAPSCDGRVRSQRTINLSSSILRR